jgi:hypothetical protein
MHIYVIASERNDEERTVVQATVVGDRVDDAVRAARDAWDAALVLDPTLGENPFVPAMITAVSRSTKIDVIDVLPTGYNGWAP